MYDKLTNKLKIDLNGEIKWNNEDNESRSSSFEVGRGEGVLSSKPEIGGERL